MACPATDYYFMHLSAYLGEWTALTLGVDSRPGEGEESSEGVQGGPPEIPFVVGWSFCVGVIFLILS